MSDFLSVALLWVLVTVGGLVCQILLWVWLDAWWTERRGWRPPRGD